MQPNENSEDTHQELELGSSEDGSGIEQALDEVLEGVASEPVSGSETVDERVAAADREVLRARAELENFRKRMQRDSDQQLKYANMSLVRDLVEVVDNLNRAIEAARDENASAPALREGVEMVTEQLSGVLAKHGCRPIESLGTEFDPNFHEAIAQTPSEQHAAGHVAQEVAVGYVLHDRVVRPSNVIVSTGPADQ